MNNVLITTFLLLFFAVSTNIQAQSMELEYVPGGTTIGSWTSTSDCMNNTLCYALKYTPALTGTLTSYTTGFFVDCPGHDPVISNGSIIMTDNSGVTDACAGSSLVLMNSSGNSGTMAVTANVPIYIHQICFSLEAGESINIEGDDLGTGLTASYDTAGGPDDESPSFSTQAIVYNVICSAAPVDWLSFSAKPADGDVLLDWATATESNNSHFVVEWSTDGRQFQALEQVVGAGFSNATQYYSTRHRNPVNGLNYYRIKQVDFDGTFSYSTIRSVQFGGDDAGISVFPNPAQNDLQLILSNSIPENAEIEIIDALGRIQQTQILPGNTPQARVDVQELPTGVYWLRIQSRKSNFLQQFIKT